LHKAQQKKIYYCKSDIKFNGGFVMDNRGQSAIAGVAIATLVFLIVLTVYGQVQSSLNTAVFSAGVVNLINLIPLVLVGAAIIGIIVVAFRLSA